MKKIFLAFLIGLIYIPVMACDICGLGTSNYNPFLFPHLSKNYISFNYLHRLYHIHGDEGINKEYFNTFLISGQYSISEKLQLVAMLPYHSNKEQSISGSTNAKGAGDI